MPRLELTRVQSIARTRNSSFDDKECAQLCGFLPRVKACTVTFKNQLTPTLLVIKLGASTSL